MHILQIGNLQLSEFLRRQKGVRSTLLQEYFGGPLEGPVGGLLPGGHRGASPAGASWEWRSGTHTGLRSCTKVRPEEQPSEAGCEGLMGSTCYAVWR